jgi:hypothetical protein
MIFKRKTENKVSCLSEKKEEEEEEGKGDGWGGKEKKKEEEEKEEEVEKKSQSQHVKHLLCTFFWSMWVLGCPHMRISNNQCPSISHQ